MMNLSKKIQQLRLDKDLSQSELASRINRSRQFIVNIENQKTSPTIKDVVEISVALGVKPTDIIFHNNDTNEAPSEDISAKHHDKLEKFEEVLLYVLSQVGARPNIGETALYKILYFIDFHYYKETGRSITNARYIRNHFGPTPVEFKSVIDKMIQNEKVVRVNSKFFQYEQRKYIPLSKSDLSLLSAAEKHHIDSVIAYYGDKTASELSNITHGEKPWKETAQGSVINYRLINS